MFIPIEFPFFTFTSFLLFSFLTVYAFRYRDGVGGTYLLLSLFLSSVLAIASVFELMSENLSYKILWRNIQQIPLFISPLALYAGVLELVGKDKRKVSIQASILSIPVFVYLLLIFTDPVHHLMRQNISISSFGELTRLNIESTQLSLCFILYTRIITLFLIVTLVRNLKTVSAFNRKQFNIILLAVIIPFILTIFKQILGVNISSSTSSIPGGLLIFYSIIQHKFLSVSPMAKDKIIENLSEAIIVINQNDLIIDINPSAKEILKGVIFQNKEEIIGKNIKQALNCFNELITFITEEPSGKKEIELNERHYSLNVIPVRVAKGVQYKLLILTDLTDRILYEKYLYKRATTDYLTKVYNRQYLNEMATQKILELGTTWRHLSLLVLDIDRFKTINDSYGHQSGDRVLEELGSVLTCKVSSNGIVGRMGGEEFAILIPGFSEVQAFQYAEEIRKYISDMEINIGDHRYLSITISIGIKSIKDPKATFQDLYKEADRALYISKEKGRNQTSIAKQFQTTNK